MYHQILAKVARVLAMASATRRTIKSLQRAIDILGLFDGESPELGITEIAEALDLHKSTVAGLVYTLEDNDYLVQDITTRKYRLGFRLLERAFTLLDQIDLRVVARPHLDELRDWCDESVNLAIRDGEEIVYIERLATTQTLGMRAKVGYRGLMHCTALGKAILAWSARSDVEQIAADVGLPAATSKAITDLDQLLEELVRVREQGFALDDEENEVGVRCVAAPILNHVGQPVAAVSVSAPAHRLPVVRVPVYGARVKEAADAISLSLGYGF
jgi:DNA-binding IclR family transcriptional regulator